MHRKDACVAARTAPARWHCKRGGCEHANIFGTPGRAAAARCFLRPASAARGRVYLARGAEGLPAATLPVAPSCGQWTGRRGQFTGVWTVDDFFDLALAWQTSRERVILKLGSPHEVSFEISPPFAAQQSGRASAAQRRLASSTTRRRPERVLSPGSPHQPK